MNNLDEFIAIQHNAMELQKKTSLYIESQLPEFKKFFYCTIDQGVFTVDGDQMDLFINIGFVIPELIQEKNSITEITLNLNSIFTKSNNTIQEKDFEINIRKQEIDSFSSFFILNHSKLEPEVITYLLDNYKQLNTNTHNFAKKDLVLEKQESSQMLFTDFLLNSNQEFIQHFFQEQLINKLNIDIGSKNLKKIRDNFNQVFHNLIISLYSKNDMGLKINSNKFEDLLLVVNQHDTAKRFIDLNQNLPDKNNTAFRHKI